MINIDKLNLIRSYTLAAAKLTDELAEKLGKELEKKLEPKTFYVIFFATDRYWFYTNEQEARIAFNGLKEFPNRKLIKYLPDERVL